MYICQFCKGQSKPRERAHKVVVATRPREYEPLHEGGHFTFGFEIVRELIACGPCAAKDQGLTELVRLTEEVGGYAA